MKGNEFSTIFMKVNNEQSGFAISHASWGALFLKKSKVPRRVLNLTKDCIIAKPLEENRKS